MRVIFRHFRGEGGCNSFMIADAHTKEACLIDPRMDDVDLYENILAQKGLKLTWVLDTHTHADHYSATHVFARDFGARIAMSAETKSARPDHRLKDGEFLEIGQAGIQSVFTPGHTPDSACYKVKAEWGEALFTGDTLFIGGSGRTDFPGADPEAQFDSLHQKLAPLPAATWILPGHDYSGLLFSDLKTETGTNPHFQIKDRKAFAEMKRQEVLESGMILNHIIDFNLNANPTARPRAGVHTLCASTSIPASRSFERVQSKKLHELLQEGQKKNWRFIDIREPHECVGGMIEGTVNIPMGELLMHCRDFEKAEKVYLVCQRGNRTQVASESLYRVGLKNVADLEGGFLNWIASELPVTKK